MVILHLAGRRSLREWVPPRKMRPRKMPACQMPPDAIVLGGFRWDEAWGACADLQRGHVYIVGIDVHLPSRLNGLLRRSTEGFCPFSFSSLLLVPTLCVGTSSWTHCVPSARGAVSAIAGELRRRAAERPRLRSHAERGNEEKAASPLINGFLFYPKPMVAREHPVGSNSCHLAGFVSAALQQGRTSPEEVRQSPRPELAEAFEPSRESISWVLCISGGIGKISTNPGAPLG